MYLIEKTKDSDYGAIFDLMKANMHLMQSEIGLEWNQTEIENNYRNKSNYSIYRRGDLAAFVSLAINDLDVFVHTLQVKDKYQNGMVGYTVFRHISKLAKESRVSTLKCCVFENNPARHMYEELGFRETSRENQILKIELNLSSVNLRGISTQKSSLRWPGYAEFFM